MKRLRGFAILSAIFILVVLAMLGAFIMNISSSQQIGSALDVQGVRAYQAARAGIEWGVYQVQATAAYNFGYGNVAPLEVGKANPNLRSCAAANDTLTVFDFTVTVTCVATADGSNGPTVYALTSTACSQPSGGACPNTTDPGAFYVERRMAVVF